MNFIKRKPLQKKIAKVPVVIQLEFLECGAACLAMILAYYKKRVPLEKVRADCGVSRDGSNAKNILLAARNYGLKAKGYSLETEQLIQSGTFPCIIHWNFNHFVVLKGFKRNKAYINDPAMGDYCVSMEEFNNSFTGICLMFEPNESFKPSKKEKGLFDYLKFYIQGKSSAIYFLLLVSLITSLIETIKPIFARIFVDDLLVGKNSDWIPSFLFSFSCLILIEIIIEFIHKKVHYRINGKIASYGSTSFVWKVLRLPMEFFSQRMAGDIQNRKISNEQISTTFIETFAPLILKIINIFFYLFVMIRYSLFLSIIGISSIIINSIVSRIITKKSLNITRVAMSDNGKLIGTTVSGIEMIETIKANGAENGFFKKWAGFQANVNAQKIKFIRLHEHLGLIPSLVNSITSILIVGLGVYFTIQGKFSLGMIMAFQGFMNSFITPANSLIMSVQGLQEMRSEIERVEDIMLYPCDENCVNDNENEEEDDDEYSKLTGNIEIKNLTFGYSPLAEPLIENFDLSLKPGSRIALVGSSGCGKSTISKLLSGLYKPWSGEILFDGKHINEIDRSVFRGSLAVVDQEITLFEDTIENNIKMWDNSIEDFEVILAARDALIHEDIMLRENGYKNQIIENGRNFSGGERQRLEIARVLAQDPTIIILDEATSALDVETEGKIINSINARGITCIIIAHRLSTIRDCDEIIVLDNGKVIERGTHQELYEKNGMYTALVSN